MEFTRKDYGYKQCNLDSKLTTKTSLCCLSLYTTLVTDTSCGLMNNKGG